MHGRSLVRTLDAGVVVIVTIAIVLLCLLAWAARSMDQTSFETEAVIVQRQLGRLVLDFRSELPAASAAAGHWIEERPQAHAILTGPAMQPAVLATPGSRVAALLSDKASSLRLQQARELLAKLDPQRKRTDFVVIGPAGDESLALISQVESAEGLPGLAVSVVDFSELSIDLEAVSIALRPLVVADEAAKSTNGRVTLAGVSGDTIAALAWKSRRASSVISTTILPILACCLVLGLAALMMLRHYWRVARDGFLQELRVVEKIAHSDALTGLPNRRALFEHLNKVAPADQRFPAVSVLVLDLDGFKWVNDTGGHQAGDRVLAQAGQAFSEELPEGGFLARLGGDEFVVVLPGVYAGDALARLHDNFSAALRERVSLPGGLPIGVSIGAVSSAHYACDGEELLRLADLAVYSAKAAGRGVAVSYDPGMKLEKEYRRAVERDLRAAMLDKALFLAHQPIVEALDGKIIGYESLVRWQHPVRGVVSPADFIPIAEQSDLIVGIGNYVLDLALRELGPLGDLRISVNATGRQLLSENFETTVINLLRLHGVEPRRLCLELTETSLITERERVAEVMAALQAIGVKFAIDDFGVGYSSLSYLLRFKFDVLKIDRDFIASLDDKPEAPMIVTAIVALARSLGMQVVGEGIETAAQHRFLASAGCNALQGYLFGKPGPVSELDIAALNLAAPKDLAVSKKSNHFKRNVRAA